MLTLSLNKDQALEDKKVKRKEKELEKDDARTDRLSLTEQGSVFVQEEKKTEDEPPSKKVNQIFLSTEVVPQNDSPKK